MGLQPRQAASIARSVFHTREVDDTAHIGGHFEECKVHHINGNDLYFTRPMFDNNKTVYGPAPFAWPQATVTGATSVSTFGTHTHTEGVPPQIPVPGDRVLIAWVRSITGGFRPWVLGWSAT